MDKTQEITKKILDSTCKVFKGNDEIVKMILAGIFAGGHVLLEDVPGTGKTVLAKAISNSLGLDFSRIQCTPDLMPSDITGSSVWLPAQQSFEFRPGPLFSSIVLVDELNRATPRTQSALLEAMAERQISVDGNLHKLDNPFFVIATENPVESSEGTFPLPEAQKDRFMMTLSIGYPSEEQEIEIITAQRSLIHPVEQLEAVVTKDEILQIMKNVVTVYVDDAVMEYLMEIVKATRQDSRLSVGVSPRGSIALYKAAQSYALTIEGRDFVTPEDIKKLCVPVFKKRIILKGESLVHGYSAEGIIRDCLEKIPVPAFKVSSK
ncbi:MAG: MoxR family ATPase [Treponema sp.]|nr:MoxR family ATPase [Treponema sp.]